MIAFGRLKDLSQPELRKLAVEQGLSPHWKAKSETIIQMIMNSVTAQPVQTIEKPRVEKEVFNNTPQQVEAAIAHIKAKKPEFMSEYNQEDNTVHFRYKGAEECLNLAQPIKIILARAMITSRGRIALLSLNEHFEKVVSNNPNNTYTSNVLTAG